MNADSIHSDKGKVNLKSTEPIAIKDITNYHPNLTPLLPCEH
ncbi:hypothetical protein DP49_5704 [Burkholderia pseudomallei]|nr:hypothetical protein DP49_5704 [Burkholderia pseudomallei]